MGVIALEILGYMFLGCLLVIFIIIHIKITNKASNEHLAQLGHWAEKNSFTIVKHKSPGVNPWMFAKSTAQRVYHVTLTDQNGEKHSAWVRTGGFLLGAITDQVDVRWVGGEPRPPGLARQGLRKAR